MKYLKLTILSFAWVIIGLAMAGSADGATDVYYSVGQNTTSHETGSGTVTVSGTTATFTVAQTAVNMGVGDVVDYDTDNKKCYISGKTSTTVWSCVSATGGTPTAAAAVAVNSIAHAYTSLSAAEAGASDANHLNTTDLVAGDYILNLPCYYDTGADTTAVTIDGWTTGANNYIKIYTPNNTSTEVNVSQRHSGKVSSGKYRLEGSGEWANGLLLILESYTRVEGLQIKNTSAFAGSALYAEADYLRVADSVAYGALNSGFHINGGGGYSVLINNIASGNTGNGIVAGNGAGVFILYAYNCIAVNNGGSGYYVTGWRTLTCKNCYAGGNAGADYTKQSADSILNLTTSYSEDGSESAPTAAWSTSFGGYFTNVTPGSEDVHIGSSSVLKNAGTDLGADTYWVHPNGSVDIDGHTRSGTWDIGADEGATAVFYSVGQSASDLKSGSPTVTIVSGVATFSVAQTGNIGVGDRVTYNTNSIAYIASKTSTTVWKLVTATGGTPGDVTAQTVNSITREYTSLSAAEAGAADASHLNTTDLATGNYVLNFPCYYDTGADTTAVIVDGWTTGLPNYIKIYTPNNTSTEANVPQRHPGKWDAEKYNLDVSIAGGGVGIRIRGAYHIWIDGLQIKNAAPNNGATAQTGIVSWAETRAVREYKISNNILRGVNNPSQSSYHHGAISLYASFLAGSKIYIWNNVMYDFYTAGSWPGAIESNDAGNKTVYVYNNTIYNCYYGIIDYNGNSFIAKNNISYNNVDNYYGTFNASSANNLSGPTQTDAPGSNPQNAKTVIFADEANDDFYLSFADTNAREAGADLSADADLPFSTDIDGHSRPTQNSWDIGADEATTKIYRSVGPSATSALSVGTSNALTISGSTATFASALPDNIGVGDALQYDDDGDSDIDANDSIVFIYGRNSSTSYSVKTASGVAPTAVSGDNNWSIFRAYTSLANAEGGTTENTDIDSDLRNFDTWSGGKDIVASNEQWNIAAYANGTTADTTAMNIGGWTTAANNYIRIYTPTLSSEVGVSQRHQGAWNTGKYRIEDAGSGSTVYINEEYVRVDGLQLKRVSTGNQWPSGIYLAVNNIASDIQVSNNIITADLTGLVNYGSGISRLYDASLNAKIWNNIIYNWTGGAGSTDYGISMATGTGYSKTFYVYNNTIYNCDYGFGPGDARTIAILKNNIAYNNVDNYNGGLYSASSTNNLSGPGTDAQIPATNKRDGVTVSFADAANADFHLTSADTGAKGYGIDLADDSNLSFQEDIDGQHRSGDPDGSPWDIGADEFAGTTLQSSDQKAGSLTDGLVLYQSFDGPDISGATAHDRSGQGNNGTITGATAAIGKRGQALIFDGTASYARTTSNIDINSDIAAVSFWLNWNAFANDDKLIMELSANYNDNEKTFIINPNSSSGSFEVAIRDSGWRAERFSRPSAGAWHHYFFVFDNSTTSGDVVAYIDGVEQSTSLGTNNKSGSGNFKTDTLYLMSRAGSGLFGAGKLDEVRVYNRALSASEISELYALGQEKINMSLADKMTDGLVGMWSFDGADMDWSQATAEARDTSGNGNHGDVSGAVATVGKRGQALSFDGDDEINIGDSSSLKTFPDGYTINLWIKSASTNNSPIGRWSQGYGLWNDNNWYSANSGGWVWTGAGRLTDNQWHMYTVKWDLNYMTSYRDGTQFDSDPATGLLFGDLTLSIGKDNRGGDYFTGSIDEVRIYNRALSADEVGDLYRLGQVKIKK